MINRFIKIFISTDLMINMATGFINPIFAIFLISSVKGGSVALAGTAAAVYWFTKSALRIPIGLYLDKKAGEKDDYYALLLGFMIYALGQFMYLWANTPAHIIIIQVFMGIGGAFAYTSWYGFFTRHIDRSHESYEWSVSVSLTGFALAATSFLSGQIVEKYGFSPLFILSGLCSMAGVVLLLVIRKRITVIPKIPE